MARAIWNGKVIAESRTTETVEGNTYFPESSLKREYFRPSSTTSLDPVKGQARYMNLLIDGQDNLDAAYYYPAAFNLVVSRPMLLRCRKTVPAELGISQEVTNRTLDEGLWRVNIPAPPKPLRLSGRRKLCAGYPLDMVPPTA
jgi:hypothetical protein